jgi:hypothetical protein
MTSSLNSGPQLKRDRGSKITEYIPGSRLRFNVNAAGSGARLQLPVFAAPPATCTVGELCVSGGKLYVCTTTNAWVVAGSQT